ncbi:MAG TPA: phosphoribosyltransferase [Terracidiphilus sp.]|jgi:predicted phosphoribosyltransferase|nr:phosphoribosyltransferase [Terracidiphilus sp.]
MLFHDRTHAGQLLADRLVPYAGQPDLLVLALPRGGVPVAFEIARALHAPLDVWVVRKLGAPRQPELAIGAVAPGGVQVLSSRLIAELGIPPDELDHIVARERAELDRRLTAYRSNRPPVDVRGKTVLLVDDGLATGASMRAAVASLRPLDPARIVVAIPVADSAVCTRLTQQADQVVCLYTPPRLDAVGQWYEDFSQTTDEEVRNLLARTSGQ